MICASETGSFLCLICFYVPPIVFAISCNSLDLCNTSVKLVLGSLWNPQRNNKYEVHGEASTLVINNLTRSAWIFGFKDFTNLFNPNSNWVIEKSSKARVEFHQEQTRDKTLSVLSSCLHVPSPHCLSLLRIMTTHCATILILGIGVCFLWQLYYC